jgi:hypothetical protein
VSRPRACRTQRRALEDTGGESLRDGTADAVGAVDWEQAEGTGQSNPLATLGPSSAEPAGRPEESGAARKSTMSEARFCDRPASTARGWQVRGTRPRSGRPPKLAWAKISTAAPIAAVISQGSHRSLLPSRSRHCPKCTAPSALRATTHDGPRNITTDRQRVRPIPPSSGRYSRSRR